MMLPYDARAADVWSLGVILFQMIHHKWPFPAEQLDELTEKVATEVRTLTHTFDLAPPVRSANNIPYTGAEISR
jgi:serine/threonine protein kinase